MNILRMRAWSPYVVGALIGALSWFTFATADKALGVSTTFVRVVGLTETAIVPEHAEANSYFAKTKLKVDWQMMLVVGVFVGAMASSLLSRDRKPERVPDLWQRRFGSSRALRYAAAFVGGGLLLFGARMASGCTSGHGISGTMQLAVGSWVFFLTLFVAGIATAFALFRKERDHV